ncbi:uncharacterized protein BJX67DRAFT_383975 [Aspergillus lucknowensis]|uniref:Uncharacterized protein n=1 Tax=Aspergillus lucknowensis TaxID=176173 RepID=A0ABR4LJ53_9EURO
MRSILLSIVAALTGSIIAAIPNPDSPNTSKATLSRRGSQPGLIARDDIPNKEKIGYLIFSHSRVASLQCSDLYTMKWGDEGGYESCTDDSVDSAFAEFCDIKVEDEVKVDTPMGEGIWWPDADQCGKGGNPEGFIITAMDDTSATGYECVRDDHQFTENCGMTWASHLYMKCTYKGEL